MPVDARACVSEEFWIVFKPRTVVLEVPQLIMFSPGAKTSTHEPQFDLARRASSMVVAPTVIAVAAPAGLLLAASTSSSLPAVVLGSFFNAHDYILKLGTHNKVNARLCQLD